MKARAARTRELKTLLCQTPRGLSIHPMGFAVIKRRLSTDSPIGSLSDFCICPWGSFVCSTSARDGLAHFYL